MRYQALCGDVLSENFQFGAKCSLEGDFWEIHDLHNRRFRKRLKDVSHWPFSWFRIKQVTHLLVQFQEAQGKRKHVERRKTEKRFLDFIKSTQRFYRDHLRNLSTRYGSVIQLDAIAKGLKFSSMISRTLLQPHWAILLTYHCSFQSRRKETCVRFVEASHSLFLSSEPDTLGRPLKMARDTAGQQES